MAFLSLNLTKMAKTIFVATTTTKIGQKPHNIFFKYLKMLFYYLTYIPQFTT